MSTIALHSRGSIGAIGSSYRRWLACSTVILAAIAACACGSRAHADVITAQSFRLEIATNLVWLDNNTNPTVQLLNSQQNFFDRQVAHANPFLRITNMSDHSRIVAAELNLSNSAAKISNVEWLETPGEAKWQWDTSNNHAMFDFVDPILPGKSASMRLTTAQQSDSYVLNQNLFEPRFFVDGVKAQYGVVTLSVQETTSDQRVRFDLLGDPIGLTVDPAPMYDLANPIETPRVNYGVIDNYGLVTVASIQPVPEPGTLAMAGMASAMLGLWGLSRRIRSGGLGKA
jgi:PEP-CTERM motif